MTPSSIKDINPEVADQLGLSIGTVAKINELFWGTTKEKLNSLESNEVYLASLGSFKTKPWNFLKKKRKWLKDMLIIEKKGNTENSIKYKELRRQLDNLYELEKQLK